MPSLGPGMEQLDRDRSLLPLLAVNSFNKDVN